MRRAVGVILAVMLIFGGCAKKETKEETAPQTPVKTFTVVIQTDSTVEVGGRAVPLDSLLYVLQMQGCDSTAQVTLKPAGDVTMATVDTVRQMLHRLGVERLTYKAPTK